jgi:hypothetical protein
LPTRSLPLAVSTNLLLATLALALFSLLLLLLALLHSAPDELFASVTTLDLIVL